MVLARRGPVQPYERIGDDASAPVPDRLTREMLVEYLDALGIAVDDAGRYGDASVIRQLPGPSRVGRGTLPTSAVE